MIRTSSIGDVVLATAALDYAREWAIRNGKTLELHWVGREPALDLVRCAFPDVRCHLIDDLLKNDTDQLPEQVDACVDLQGNLRSRRLSWRIARQRGAMVTRPPKRYFARMLLVGIARVFGRNRASLVVQKMLLRALPPVPQYRLAAGAVARALGGDQSGLEFARPVLLASQEIAAQLRLDPQRRWLAIAPGASHLSKKAPATVFERVLGAFDASFDGDEGSAQLPGIVLVGDRREVADCEEMKRRLTANQWQGPVVNLAGTTSLPETLAVLSSCTAILCNDSSLGHMAESIGKPSVVLFGPTSESFGFAPQRPDSRAFSTTNGCRPCSKHGAKPCRYGDMACFTGIDTRAAGATLAGFFK